MSLSFDPWVFDTTPDTFEDWLSLVWEGGDAITHTWGPGDISFDVGVERAIDMQDPESAVKQLVTDPASMSNNAQELPQACNGGVSGVIVAGPTGFDLNSHVATHAADEAQVVVPSPRHEMFGTPPLPEKFAEIREHQWNAVLEVVAAFEDGADVVMLDAPTGTGKTLVAECVRRLMKAKAMYICSSLTLQDQFLADFPYASLLKGRSNYPTMLYPFPDVTAADCTAKGGDRDCMWCVDKSGCEYERAKSEALRNDLTVVNTAYFFNEANYIGRLSGRELVVVDECDVLERELMGFVEFNLSSRQLGRLGVDVPKKGVHKKTLAEWFEDELIPGILKRVSTLPRQTDDVKVIRERNGLERMLDGAKRIARELASEEAEERDNWVRDYKDSDGDDKVGVVMKPTKVDGYGEEMVWQHGNKWLLMSATIISADEMADSLGLGAAGLDWRVVRVPMTFPKERRQIHVAPVAYVSAKTKDEAYPAIARSIRRLMDRHPDERILVHTVSYEFASYLHRELSNARCLTYRNARERAGVLSKFLKQPSAVLLASSFDRGVDLAGDACRVVVVAKVPFPYLGDKQVSARMRASGGGSWYAVQTIRTLIQMTGRGMRSEDDTCESYILDGQFVKKVKREHGHLLPAWWKEALDMRFDVRELVR